MDGACGVRASQCQRATGRLRRPALAPAEAAKARGPPPRFGDRLAFLRRVASGATLPAPDATPAASDQGRLGVKLRPQGPRMWVSPSHAVPFGLISAAWMRPPSSTERSCSPLDSASRGKLRGSQGMGVGSNNWFDRVLLSIIDMFKPSC